MIKKRIEIKKKTAFVLILCFGFLFFIWSGMFLTSILLIISIELAISKFYLSFFKGKVPENTFAFLNYVPSLLGLIALALFFRTFFFEIYFIPTSSMERTLSKGDVALIDKLCYGPIAPNSLSELPFVSLFTPKKRLNSAEHQKRLKGYKWIVRHDVVVFKNKLEDKAYIKRILGLPNEFLDIRKSKVFINNVVLDEKQNYTYEYRLNNDEPNHSILLSNEEFNEFNFKERLEKIVHEPNSTVDEIYPKENIFIWNRDNYGPIWVPSKGKSILIDKQSIIYYKKIIEKESGLKVIDAADGYYLEKKLLIEYEFKENYYFVLGDNRHYSRDSRAIGFISETDIVGKYIAKF